MKILQVMAGAPRGGAETAFVDMCLALHEAGETQEIVTRANDLRIPQLEQAGITVHTLPFGGKPDIYTKWRMRKIIKSFQPQIVQTWMSRAPVKTPKWSSKMGVPEYKVVARLGSNYKIKYFGTVDYFIAITPAIKEYLISQGIHENKITFINNFAETEGSFTPINRSDFGTPEDEPLLVNLARLHPAKALDTLIKSVAQLNDVHLWIAGEGPQRCDLEKLINNLEASERIKLLGWRTDRAALLNAADICVFTSRAEGFGTVFVQAWANKTPLIVSDADGPRQFVRHNEDGLIVETDDQEALAQAIRTLADDKKLQKKFSKNGYKRYLEEFTKETCVEKYLAFYQKVLPT